MNVTCLDVSDAILNELKTDETLSSYVKRIVDGKTEAAQKIYPFVSVGGVDFSVEPLTIGRSGNVVHYYTIEIIGGVNHILPEVAHMGDGKEKKGIVQLAGDIVSAIYPGTLGGIFERSVRVVELSTAHRVDSGGRTWIARMVLSGRRSVASDRRT